MARPLVYVEAPQVQPLPFGLTSAAVVTDDLDGHAAFGFQYEPEACGVAYATRGPCEEQAASFATQDTGIALVVGAPATLYTHFVCAPVGRGEDGLRERAARSLTIGESRGLEAVVGSRLPLAAGAVDLTGGAAVHPVTGLGLLERFAASNYGGVPTLHVPRHVGTVLTTYGAVDRYGPRLETKQGALVASGGGYTALQGPPTNAADPATVQTAGAGEAWIYVTGTVLVKRGRQVSATPLVVDAVRGGVSGVSNQMSVLAERAYATAWECITAAVRVTTPFRVPA